MLSTIGAALRFSDSLAVVRASLPFSEEPFYFFFHGISSVFQKRASVPGSEAGCEATPMLTGTLPKLVFSRGGLTGVIVQLLWIFCQARALVVDFRFLDEETAILLKIEVGPKDL